MDKFALGRDAKKALATIRKLEAEKQHPIYFTTIRERGKLSFGQTVSGLFELERKGCVDYEWGRLIVRCAGESAEVDIKEYRAKD